MEEELIPTDRNVLSATLNYLNTKPWGEVNTLVTALVQTVQAHDVEKKGAKLKAVKDETPQPKENQK